MIKTIKIEGMNCKHCSGAVEKQLNALEGVTATVDLEAKTATVDISDAGVTDGTLCAAVEEAGFTVVGIL